MFIPESRVVKECKMTMMRRNEEMLILTLFYFSGLWWQPFIKYLLEQKRHRSWETWLNYEYHFDGCNRIFFYIF